VPASVQPSGAVDDDLDALGLAVVVFDMQQPVGLVQTARRQGEGVVDWRLPLAAVVARGERPVARRCANVLISMSAVET
jgi:hypothetical protein